MLRRTSRRLEEINRWASPVPSATWRAGHFRYSTNMKSEWSRFFWKYSLNDDRRTPFWVSDFKHRYLIRTGKDHKGPMPAHAPPGSYQGLNRASLFMHLRDMPPAERETRRLPILPLTARISHEHYLEAKSERTVNTIRNKALLAEVADTELHHWYGKVQRVRGRWCRDQGIASRGVYSAAIDAAELWG